MRILWISNNVQLPTAYAQQTAMFVPRIQNAGHHVSIFAIAGCDGAPQVVALGDSAKIGNGVPTTILPRAAHPFGNDIVQGHVDFVKADVVMSLFDPHVVDPNIYRQFNWCAWAPIDCSPVSPAAVKALRAARWIWCPSKYGVKQLNDAGFNNVTYVPHGVDSSMFRLCDRVAARQILHDAIGSIGDGIENKFLVVMNAANRENPPRKGFAEAFTAFKIFSDKIGKDENGNDKTLLYVHTESRGMFGGINLLDLVQEIGVEDRVAFAPQYNLVSGMLTQQFLVAVYGAADVYFSASHGEGFCLPIVESAMCGTASVVPHNTSHPEVCRVGFSFTRCEPYETFGIHRFKPDVNELAETLETAYNTKVDRDFVRESVLDFDVNNVFNKYMKSALEKIANDIS